MKRVWNDVFSSCMLGVLVGASTGATTARADHFRPLSPSHTAYGVSQLVYGNIPQVATDAPSPALKLINPNHVTQAVATLIYSSSRGPSGAGLPTEAFLACKVGVVTPHGSSSISDGQLVVAGAPAGRPLYSEHIWAPLETVSVGEDDGDDHDKSDRSDKSDSKKRRIADGLGGNVESASFERQLWLAHPGLFSLPSNTVVPGQRERAIRCICTELAALRLPANIFSDFTVRCP